MIVVLIAFFCGAVSAQTGPNEVAFSAGLSQDLTLLHAEKVVYDKIFTNIGAGYDSATGNFNCPLSGIYVFQFHILAKNDKSTWLELYKNAYYIASVYGHTANDYAAAGNSVILTLSKGDQVSIRAVDFTYGAGTEMYGRVNEVYSTFSGYMIQPIIEEIPALGK